MTGPLRTGHTRRPWQAARPLAVTVAVAALVAVAASPVAAATPPGPASGAVSAARPGAPIGTTPLAAYTLIAPTSAAESGLVVRAVVPAGAACPSMTVTVRTSAGQLRVRERELTRRVPPATVAPAFSSVAVCQARMPVNAVRAAVGGIPVPAAYPDRVDEIALFGDTGCRIRGSLIQDCSSPQAWPLAAISQRIADARPDIVLNIGDFFYREAACPAASQALCGGSPPPVAGLPFPDTDYGWLADVIVPMAPMLSVAPLVMLRGNHEACNRGGNGYFLFLDPRPDTAATCAPTLVGGVLTAPDPATTPTWATTLRIDDDRTLRLAMVDSTYGADDAVTSWAASQRPTYEAAAELTAERPGRESWLLTHRPLYGLVTTQFAPPGSTTWTPWSALDQAAASYGLLDTYDLVLSSHIHVVQSVQVPGLPAQLVFGNGGTLLDPPTGYAIPAHGPMADATGAPLVPGDEPYPPASAMWTAVRFGYALATPGRQAGRWSITHLDPQGEAFAQCRLRDAALSCADL